MIPSFFKYLFRDELLVKKIEFEKLDMVENVIEKPLA
jgi:hypothetical protein